MSQKPIRIGIIGAGLFAKENHIPAFLNLTSQFQIAAICTNTPESAAKVQAMLPEPVVVYHNMDDLIKQKDIEAVDILLPIDMLPDAVEMSLVAGKHVISEKPIAPTVGIATKLIEIYERFTSQIWMVAENFRYAATLVRAAELVRADSIGKPAIAGWTIYAGLGLGARNAGIIREG